MHAGNTWDFSAEGAFWRRMRETRLGEDIKSKARGRGVTGYCGYMSGSLRGCDILGGAFIVLIVILQGLELI